MVKTFIKEGPIECRYCKHKVLKSQPRVILLKKRAGDKSPQEEYAHLTCYTEQLFGFVERLTFESVKLLQSQGFVI